jgi:SulP family sulfate permease
LTLFLGFGSLIFLIMANKFLKKIPAPVVMLTLSSLVVVIFNLAGENSSWQALSLSEAKVVTVKDFGEISSLAVQIATPLFDMQILGTLLPIAFAIALLGVLEVSTISRNLATQSGETVSINKEMMALGTTNFLVPFLGGMACSGSFIRSSLNYTYGAKSRMAGVLSALFVALIFLIFQPLVLNIPQAALAALLICASMRMVNVKELLFCIKATGADAFVFIITALSAVLFNIQMGFYVGVILSIVCYMKQAAKLQVSESGIDPEGNILDSVRESSPVRLLQIKGELFFAAMDLLQSTGKTIVEENRVKVMVLHMASAHHMDATACVVIESLHHLLKKAGKALVVCGITREVWQVFCNSGLTKEIGVERLFLLNSKMPEQSLQRAFMYAYELSQQPKFHQVGEKEEEFGVLVPSTGSHLKRDSLQSTTS